MTKCGARRKSMQKERVRVELKPKVCGSPDNRRRATQAAERVQKMALIAISRPRPASNPGRYGNGCS